MSKILKQRLSEFANKEKFSSKGPLSVALVITEKAKNNGLPLDSEELLTKSKGQVKGLGKAAVQKILHRNNIERILAKEGGRTSRGSIDNMETYVSFLNSLEKDGLIDFSIIEGFWIQKVREFFAGHPFTVNLDESLGYKPVIVELLIQVRERQKEMPSKQIIGAVLQHLTGAKLTTLFPEKKLEHHSYSTADAPTSRAGDFCINDVVIHVTSAPGPGLIDQCKSNLRNNLKPIIITVDKGAAPF